MLRQQQQAGNKLLYSMVWIYTAMLVHHLIYDLKETWSSGKKCQTAALSLLYLLYKWCLRCESSESVNVMDADEQHTN